MYIYIEREGGKGESERERERKREGDRDNVLLYLNVEINMYSWFCDEHRIALIPGWDIYRNTDR